MPAFPIFSGLQDLFVCHCYPSAIADWWTGAEDSSGHRYVGTNGLRVFNHHILLSSTGWTEGLKFQGLATLSCLSIFAEREYF